MMIGLKPYTPPACAGDDCTAAVAWQVQIRQHDVTSIAAYYCDGDLPDRYRRLLEGGPRSHASVDLAAWEVAARLFAGSCGPDCSEIHTFQAGCAIKPPARAFLGEKPCGKPGCPCGSVS